MEDSIGNRLDIGGGLWVSAVVEGVVPKDMLLNAVRRHRRYSLCDPLAVDDDLHAGLYAVNRASVNLVLEHAATDESGWRPRFASIWSCPVEMGPNGELSSFSYWARSLWAPMSFAPTDTDSSSGVSLGTSPSPSTPSLAATSSLS